MSARRALALAVRDQIRTAVNGGGLGIPHSCCEMTHLGQPHPSFDAAGGKGAFYGVYGTRRRNARGNPDAATCVERYHGVNVVVSMWIGPVPFDRIGTDVMDAFQTGLEPLVDALIAVLVNSGEAVMAAANAYLGTAAGTVQPITQPLIYADDSDPTVCGYDWFNCAPPEKAPRGEVVGVRSVVTLVGGTRIEAIGSSSA